MVKKLTGIAFMAWMLVGFGGSFAQAGQDEIKTVKKLLLCGVKGDHLFSLGVAKDDPKKRVMVNSAQALDVAYDEIVKQFTAAGVSVADGAQADQQALALHKANTPDIAGKMAAVGAKQGAAGASAVADAMKAAMNNPNMPPEQREMMKKYMAGGVGAPPGVPVGGVGGIPPSMVQGGMQAGAAQMVAAQKEKMGQQGRDLASMGEGIYDTQINTHGSSQTKHLIAICPKRGAERTGADNKDFYQIFDKSGADGFATVSMEFASHKTTSSKVVTNISATTYTGTDFAPRLVYNVEYFDKNGKSVWAMKKPYESKILEVGDTAATAGPAILAAVPGTITELTQTLYK